MGTLDFCPGNHPHLGRQRAHEVWMITVDEEMADGYKNLGPRATEAAFMNDVEFITRG